MQSPIIKYGILLLGVLLLLSTAEISEKESQQYYHTECHVFVGTENIVLAANFDLAYFTLAKHTLFFNLIADLALHTPLTKVKAAVTPPSQYTPLDVPLYLSISSLRI